MLDAAKKTKIAEKLGAHWESLRDLRNQIEEDHKEVADMLTKAMKLIDDASDVLLNDEGTV